MDDVPLYVDRAAEVIEHGEALRILTPRGSFTIKDPAHIVRHVVSELSVGSTRTAILEKFSAPEERAAAGKALDLLERRRILSQRVVDADSDLDPFAHWVRHFAGSQKIERQGIRVVGTGKLAAAFLVRAAAIGFHLDDNASQHSCVVAAFDGPDIGQLRQLNAETLQHGHTFLPIWLDRATIHWGPLVEPGAVGCLECLHHRQNAARRQPVESVAAAAISTRASDMIAEFGADLAVAELLRWAYDAYVETDMGMAWSFDLLTLSFAGARVLRLPRCSACGNDVIKDTR